MFIDYRVLLAYILGIAILFFLGRLLVVPMKFLLKLVYNTLLGGLVLLLVNFAGKLIDFHLALNVVTALIVGLLGVPGVIMLIILKLIFKV